MRTLLVVAGLGLLYFAVAQEQKPASDPVVSTVRQLHQRQAKNLVAAAEAMPADKYGYRPTEAQMPFGHIVHHTAEANYFLCSRLGAAATELKVKEDAPKAQLVAALRDSFDYCGGALSAASDAALGQTVQLFGGRQAPQAAALIGVTNTWSSHYSQMSMHLRLNGMLPPTAQPRPQ